MLQDFEDFQTASELVCKNVSFNLKGFLYIEVLVPHTNNSRSVENKRKSEERKLVSSGSA